jgi:hypothetical protein
VIGKDFEVSDCNLIELQFGYLHGWTEQKQSRVLVTVRRVN